MNSEDANTSQGLSARLGDAELVHLFRDRLQMSWNGLSPFAMQLAAYVPGSASAAVELDELADHPLFPVMLSVLAHPDVRIKHRYAGPGIESFMACCRRATDQVVVVFPATEDGHLIRCFATSAAYFGWWLNLLSSRAGEAVSEEAAFSLPVEALSYWLHAVDMHRRVCARNQLAYQPTDANFVSVAEFVDAMRDSVASRNANWLLPAFLLLAPGLHTRQIAPRLEHLKVLADRGCLIPGNDPAHDERVFHFGAALTAIGAEFAEGVNVAVGLSIEVWTGQGALPVFEGFLAPTRQANHLFEIEPDGAGAGTAKHHALTQRQLYARLVGLLSAALHPAAPEFALRRATLAGQEPAGAAPGDFAVSEGATPAGLILCAQCGHANPDTNKHCGQCGSRLPAQPVAAAPMLEQAVLFQVGQDSALAPERPDEAVPQPHDPTVPAAPAPQGPAISVREWFRMLSISPPVHFRFRHRPNDPGRVMAVESPGKYPAEVRISGEHFQDLASLLRAIREQRIISPETFKALHAMLRVTDGYGAIWTVGLGSLCWSRLEEGKWKPGDAPGMVWLDMDVLRAVLGGMPPSAGEVILHATGGAPAAAMPSVPVQCCRHCGQPLRKGAKFCASCGTEVGPTRAAAQVLTATVDTRGMQPCPNCAALVKAGAKFCNVCGTRMDSTAPATDAGAVLVRFTEGTLKRLVARVWYAMGSGDGPVNGLLVEIDPAELRLVATDGHRLALAKQPLPTRVGTAANHPRTTGTHYEHILARATVADLMRGLVDRETPAVIEISPSRVGFRLQGWSLPAHCVSGAYPNYRTLIPTALANVLRIDREALARTLERVSRNEPCGVQWAIAGQRLSLIRMDANHQEKSEALPVNYQGTALRLALNARYVLDALNGLDCSEVELGFGSAYSSVMLTIPGRQDFIYIVMPMRQDEATAGAG